MGADKTVEIGGRKVRIRELTVQEVRDWLRIVERGDVGKNPALALLLEDFTLFDLQSMTDVQEAELLRFTPTELAQINQYCREVNRAFFLLRDRMTAVGDELLQAETSSVPPRVWSALGMPTAGSTRWRSFWRRLTRPPRRALELIREHRRWRRRLAERER